MTRTDKGSAPGRTALIDPLASCHSADDPDLRLLGQRLIQQAAAAGVHTVDVDIDESPQFARLVEEKIGDGQLTQGLAHGARVELEPLLPARLGRERSGQ